MAKFYGRIGYGTSVETEPGEYEDVIIERQYFGDVLRNSRRSESDSDSVNDNLSVGNSISIVSDAYANVHFHTMRYIEWAGTLWKVSDITVESPRLILKLGGVYNGPKAESPTAP